MPYRHRIDAESFVFDDLRTLLARASPLRSGDVLGRGNAVTSERTRETTPRTATADTVARSVCPYCAVGCGQLVYAKDDKVIQIEGDPDSPVSRGRLCPKGSASEQLVNSPRRITTVRYRAPHASDWTDLDRDTAIDMIAAGKARDYARARAVHDRLLPLTRSVYHRGSHMEGTVALKHALVARGVLDHATVRSPLLPLPDGAAEEIHAAIQSASLPRVA